MSWFPGAGAPRNRKAAGLGGSQSPSLSSSPLAGRSGSLCSQPLTSPGPRSACPQFEMDQRGRALIPNVPSGCSFTPGPINCSQMVVLPGTSTALPGSLPWMGSGLVLRDRRTEPGRHPKNRSTSGPTSGLPASLHFCPRPRIFFFVSKRGLANDGPLAESGLHLLL